MYTVYIKSNGSWKKLTEPFTNLEKLIATLDYVLSSDREIMVKRTTDRDEIIFSSMFDDYNTFRNNAIKSMSCLELKEGILNRVFK